MKNRSEPSRTSTLSFSYLKSGTRRCQHRKKRALGFEALESRVLLSVSPMDGGTHADATTESITTLARVTGVHPAWLRAYTPVSYSQFVANSNLAPVPSTNLSLSDLPSLDEFVAASTIVNESESNNTRNDADVLTLGFDTGESWTIDVNGLTNSSGDIDYFRVELNAGDILGVNVFPTFSAEQTRVSIENASGVELVGSQIDMNTATGVATTPLPRGGRSASIVSSADGAHYISVSGGTAPFAYQLQVRLFRPALERQPESAHQILFLDFDGATVDASLFGASGMRNLSPLSSFLGDWGFSGADENALIDAILASTEEKLATSIRASGNNGDFDATGTPGEFDLTILNSRDHPDPFGAPHVSRVIVGGTKAQLGINTIGIAQSIDVGNFMTNETAVVLLDALSNPNPPSPTNQSSLNNIPIDPSTTKTDLIGLGVGTVIAHEAGHYFGNWHTDQFNGTANIMDQGGNLPNNLGLGPDGIFGSADDVNVQFVADVYNPNEPFTGIEDTLNRTAFGLSTGAVTTGGTAGRVYVVERTNGNQPTTGGEIGVYDFNGNRVGTIDSDVFNQGTISDIEIQPLTGDVFVSIDFSSTTSGQVVGFSPDGTQVQAINIPTDLPGSFLTPFGFDIAPNGDFWVTQPNLNALLRYNAQGSSLGTVNTSGGNAVLDVTVEANEEFTISRSPNALLNARSDGKFWAGEPANNRSVLVDPDNGFQIVAQRPGNAPQDPEEAPDGSLFVTNFGSATLQKFNASGTSLFNVDTGGTPIGLALAPADDLPVISVAASDPDASETGPDPGVFTLTRSGSTSSSLMVSYSLTGTATAGADFTTLSGTAMFAVGSATTTVTVAPINDAVTEGSESVILTLDPDLDLLVGGDSSATINISDGSAPLPDVIPAAPAGWDGPIVVSTVSGTNTDAGGILETNTLFVDWSLLNQSATATTVSFQSRLLIDGVPESSWTTNPPVNPGTFSFVQDFNLGTLSPGTYTITLELDFLDDLAESDETNNSFSRQFTVVAAQPDLTPFKPSAWDAPIVASIVTGTNTDAAVITSADTIFIDWAVLNQGTAATDVDFRSRILLDGAPQAGWISSPLPVNFITFVQDFPLGSLAPGVYTLTLEADYQADIAESDETNNDFMRQITVVDANNASIGDIVWHDLNGDGLQDAGEPGLDDVTVELFNAGGLVDTTTTSGGGLYSFTSLAAGDYSVRFIAPAGFVVSPQDQGGDDTADSDADATGQTAFFSLGAGQTDTSRDGGLIAASPPTVIEVLVRRSNWPLAFLDHLQSSGLGAGGYSIPTGSPDQFDSVPWLGLNQVLIRFNEDVNLQQEDLEIRGAEVGSYGFGGFSYDNATFEAIWTLSSAIADDDLLLDLDGTTGSGVVGVGTGLLLDGQFVNGVDSLPASGDGAAGGDFEFRIKVLRGDVNQNSAVTTADVGLTRSRVGNSIGDALYSALIDVNANGAITTADVGFVRSRVGTVLPGPEPTRAFTSHTVDDAFESLNLHTFAPVGAAEREEPSEPSIFVAKRTSMIRTLASPSLRAVTSLTAHDKRLQGTPPSAFFDDPEWFESLATELAGSLPLP